MSLGLKLADAEYQRIWDQVEGSPSDGEREVLDVFDSETGDLWLNDFKWMHLAGVLRDAVTSYVVYLEKAREEVCRRHNCPVEVGDESPKLWQLARFFKVIGAKVEPADLKDVLRRRDILTHRRGAIRGNQVVRYPPAVDADERLAGEVKLTQESVMNDLDVLYANVRRIDEVVYAYSWGGRRKETLPELCRDPDSECRRR